jgi:hypothetical protein
MFDKTFKGFYEENLIEGVGLLVPLLVDFSLKSWS